MMNSLRGIPLHRYFFYLLILFLPTQLGLHFWPEWSMVLGRRVDYLSPTLFFTDILIFFTLFSYASFVILNSFQDLKTRRFSEIMQNIRSRNKFGMTLSIIPLLLTTCFLLLNVILAQQPLLALTGWVKIIELLLLFLYIKQTKPKFPVFFIFFSLGVFYSCLLGLAQTIHGGSIGGLFWFLGERTFTLSTPNIAKGVICLPHSLSCIEYLRPYATFPHPNVFAGFLAVYVFFSFRYFNRKEFLVYSTLPIIVLILTFSRSAWFALGFIVLFSYFSKQLKIISLSIVILSSAILWSLPFFGQESIDVRVALNQAAINIIQNHPLTGVGIKNFLVAIPHFLPSRTIYFLQPVHNIYLLIISEIGLAGAGLLAFFLIRHRSTLRISHSAFMLLLIVGLFDHYPITLQQGQLLLIISLAYSTIST